MSGERQAVIAQLGFRRLRSSQQMKKKATITVQTERLLVISGSQAAAARLWCRGCQAEVTMFGLDDASALAGVSDRAIFQLAEAGSIHFVETADGKAMFCGPSLRAEATTRIPPLINKKERTNR